MWAHDFEYDGQYLSDYNCVIVGDIKSERNVTAGANLAFNLVSKNSGRQYSMVSSTYQSCIQTTFDIMKVDEFTPVSFGIPETGNYKVVPFTTDDYRDMMRWLNRRDFHIFRPMLNESTKAFYYNASFNVEKIEAKYQGENAIMKLRLTMFTDKPFAYGVEDKRTIETTRTNTLKEHLVTCFSDEVGDVPAHVKITCNAAGDISIKNITNNCTMTITGCTKDEVIEIDGDKQTLKSSTGRNLYKSFNYEFLRLTSAFGTRVNKITVSLPARVEISYRPIIKYGG